MEFKLCYKSYKFKVTWDAKREFYRETGEDLWATIQEAAIIGLNHSGTDFELMQKIGKGIGKVNVVTALYLIAKPMNSTLTIEEIADGCDRVGWRPIEDVTNEWNQPYPRVLQKIAFDLDDQYEKEAIKRKKDFDNSKAE